VKVDVRHVTNMALKLICPEPIRTRIEYLDWFEAFIPIRARLHDRKGYRTAITTLPRDHARERMPGVLWDSEKIL
jgi:hypothetical protein